MRPTRPPAAPLLCLLLLFVGAGCGGTKTYDAFAGEPPEKPAELRLGGDVRLVSLDGRPAAELAEGLTPDSAPPRPPEKLETEPRNPRRVLRLDPGRHTITVGQARRWLPLKRETHVALALLSGSVNYSAALYPGSDTNVRLAFDARPGVIYELEVREPKRGGRFVAELAPVKRDLGDAGVEVVAAEVPHEGDGTPLSRRAWIEGRRDAEDAAREGGAGDDLTKPTAG